MADATPAGPNSSLFARAYGAVFRIPPPPMTGSGRRADEKRQAPEAERWRRRTGSALGGGSLTVLLQLVAELPETHPEQLGRARLHSTGSSQSHLEVAVLDLLDSGLEVEAVCWNLDRHVLM